MRITIQGYSSTKAAKVCSPSIRISNHFVKSVTIIRTLRTHCWLVAVHTLLTKPVITFSSLLATSRANSDYDLNALSLLYIESRLSLNLDKVSLSSKRFPSLTAICYFKSEALTEPAVNSLSSNSNFSMFASHSASVQVLALLFRHEVWGP